MLGAVLLLGTVRLDQRLLTYRPEAFAFVLALFALWLVDRAAVERTPRMIAAAAVALGVVFATHAEVFLVVLPAAAGIALVRGPAPPIELAGGVPPRRRPAGLPWLGRRRPRRRSLAAVLGVARQRGGRRASSDSRATRAARCTAGDVTPPPRGSHPAGLGAVRRSDVGLLRRGDRPAERDLPTDFTDPRLLPRATLHIWPRLDGMTPLGRIGLIALLLVPLVLWPTLDARRRRAVAVWLTFGIGLFAGSFLIYALV